jgi:putative RecB family exonuclease
VLPTRRDEWPLDAVEVAGVPFTGFIDRADIARDGERFGCRNLDFKSGKYKGVAPFGDDHGDQLRLYAAAVQVADGRLPIAADLLYIGARRARSASLARREMAATLDGFARAWVDLKRHVAAQAFPATPTPLCGWCPLVNGCPAAARDGRAARVEGLPNAAELGIPVLRPLESVAFGSASFGPDGEPVVIPAADVTGYDPADTGEPPADPDLAGPEPAEPVAAHMEHQGPGTTGSTPETTPTTEAPR